MSCTTPPQFEGELLHVTYGDEVARRLRDIAPDAEIVVVREALRDGPLGDGGHAGWAPFVELRARFLADEHGADYDDVLEELNAVWDRITCHSGDVVLHIDVEPCVDCATFVAAAAAAFVGAGRAVAKTRASVFLVHGDDPATALPMNSRDLAAAAGAWQLLVLGDTVGLKLAAADMRDNSRESAVADIPLLLARRGEDLVEA